MTDKKTRENTVFKKYILKEKQVVLEITDGPSHFSGSSVIKRGEVKTLPFPDGFFDLVFGEKILSGAPGTANIMKEVARVLKPEGVFIGSITNRLSFSGVFKKISKKVPALSAGLSSQELRQLFFAHHFGVPSLSGKFSSVIFFEARKYDLKVKYSGIIRLPETSDEKNGTLIIGEFDKTIPFPVKRLYHITNMTDLKAVRGGHAHKKTDQVIFCIRGTFRLTLKDGEVTQKIYLRNPAYGIRLGPKLWHTMTNFSKDCVIMVLASENYDESDYIRNYDEFLTYIKNNP